MDNEASITRYSKSNSSIAASIVRNLIDPDVESITKACHLRCGIQSKNIIHEIIKHYNNGRLDCNTILNLNCGLGIKNYFESIAAGKRVPEFKLGYQHVKLMTLPMSTQFFDHVLTSYNEPLKCIWRLCWILKKDQNWKTPQLLRLWTDEHQDYKFLRRARHKALLKNLRLSLHKHSLPDQECIARHVLYNRTNTYWNQYIEMTDFPVNDLFKLLKLTQWRPSTHRRFRCRQRYEIEMVLLVTIALRLRHQYTIPQEIIINICSMVSHARDYASLEYIITGKIKNRLLAV